MSQVHDFIDCEGLAGAWSLGTVQAGFRLVSRASLAGFGDTVAEANRHLLGYDWNQQEGKGLAEWEDGHTASYVCGTPPCSGFSLLNTSAAQAKKRGKEVPDTGRGPDSSINDCMKEVVKYGTTRVTGSDGLPGAQIVAFESVQQAGKQGRELMKWMAEQAREDTGQPYELTHVFMSGASVGAAQMRHRYYFVLHRIPFGVDPPEERRVCTYRDALKDLEGLADTWEGQPYGPEGPSDWVLEQGLRDPSGLVTDHIAAHNETNRRRIYFEELWPFWLPGEGLEPPLRRYIAKYGKTPDGAEKWWNWEHDRRNGFSGPFRAKPDKCGYVLTGGGLVDCMHYAEQRGITVREGSRLMGYPDSWQWDVAGSVMKASLFIGKCCPVQSGRWISEWVYNALEGMPGEQGEKIGEHEYLHNSTNAYKSWTMGHEN